MNGLDVSLSARQRELTEAASAFGCEDALGHCRPRRPGFMVPDIVEFREADGTSTGGHT